MCITGMETGAHRQTPVPKEPILELSVKDGSYNVRSRQPVANPNSDLHPRAIESFVINRAAEAIKQSPDLIA